MLGVTQCVRTCRGTECLVQALIAERDVNDENFRGTCCTDRKAPDLDTARHENVRSIL